MAEQNLRLRVVLDLVDKALAPLKRIGEGSGETAKALKAARDQLKAMGDTQKNIGDFRQARTGLADLETKLGAAREKARALAVVYGQVGPPTKAMADAMAKARAEANAAGAAFNGQQQRIQQLRDKLSAAGISTKNLSEHERKLRADMEATTAGITKQTEALKLQASQQKRAATLKAAQQGNIAARGEARGALFDGVAMAATLGAPIKMAMDWEQRLAEFNKVASQTPQELSAIADKAQQMAVKTGVAREEIMGAYIAASQAGFDRSEWDQFADVSAKMGVAFDTTGEKAGEMLKAWRAGMNLSMDQAALLAGAVNHIANNMNAKAVDVGGVLQRQGSYLSAMGLNETQSAALAATMLSGGATEEIAATASKNFMKALTVGFAATKGQREVFDMLNVNPEKLAKVMQKAPEKAIVEVMKRMKSLKPEEMAPAMKMLFGDESIGPAAQIIKNVDGLVNAMGMVSDTSKYAQSLEDEFNAMGNTTQQQAKKAAEGVKMVSTALGTGLLPTINKTLDAFAPMAMNAARWMKSNQGLVESVIWVVGGLMLFKVAAIACAYVLTFIKGGLLAVHAGLLAARAGWMLHTGAMVAGTNAGRAAFVISKMLTGAQWLWNAALAANPLGLLIVGIMLLVAAGLVLYKYWEPIAAFFSGMWTGFLQGLAPLAPMVDATFAGIGKAVEAIRPIWDWLVDKLSAAWTWVSNLVSPINATAQSLQGATQAGQGFGAWLAGLVVDLAMIIPNFFNWGAEMVNGIIGGISSKLGELRDTVVGAASSAAAWFAKKLDMHSPSRVFMQYGGWISEGAANGIEAGQAGVRAAALAMAGAALVPVGAAQAGELAPDAAADPGAMAPMAALAPLAPRAAAGGAGAAGGISNISITIQAAPGMDERALAKLVAQELERIEQRKSFQRRSRLQDLD